MIECISKPGIDKVTSLFLQQIPNCHWESATKFSTVPFSVWQYLFGAVAYFKKVMVLRKRMQYTTEEVVIATENDKEDFLFTKCIILTNDEINKLFNEIHKL